MKKLEEYIINFPQHFPYIWKYARDFAEVDRVALFNELKDFKKYSDIVRKLYPNYSPQEQTKMRKVLYNILTQHIYPRIREDEKLCTNIL